MWRAQKESDRGPLHLPILILKITPIMDQSLNPRTSLIWVWSVRSYSFV